MLKVLTQFIPSTLEMYKFSFFN